MNLTRGFRIIRPKEFDERSEHIQFLVIRDAFVAVLLFAFLIMIGLSLFNAFIMANILMICILAFVGVGVVACISSFKRGGWNWEQQRALAKGNILIAPVYAVITMVLLSSSMGWHMSLRDWVISYPLWLVSYLLYPLFILWLARRRTNI